MDGLTLGEMFSEIQNPRVSDGSGREIQYKLLYVSPERLSSPKFLRALNDAENSGLEISHIVIDEVHCMSQWGIEFRESYLHIPRFISQRLRKQRNIGGCMAGSIAPLHGDTMNRKSVKKQ